MTLTTNRLNFTANGRIRLAGLGPTNEFIGSVEKVTVTVTLAGIKGGEVRLIGFHMSPLDGLKLRGRRRDPLDLISNLGKFYHLL